MRRDKEMKVSLRQTYKVDNLGDRTARRRTERNQNIDRMNEDGTARVWRDNKQTERRVRNPRKKWKASLHLSHRTGC